jgi:hypothetical protein
VFAYTAAGSPGVRHTWGSEALFAVVWERGGRLALLALKTLVVTATFAVVFLTVRSRGVGHAPAAGITLLAAWAGAGFWHVRSQIFTYLLVAVAAWLLRGGWEHRRHAWALVPLLVIPWVNLDPGFALAGVLIGLAAAGAALPRLRDPARRAEGWRVLGLGAAVGLGAAAASLVSPFGIRTLLFADGFAPPATLTLERFSPSFNDPGSRGFELMLLLLFPAFARGRHRLGPADVASMLVFAFLGLAAVRHVPLFAILAAPPLADALQGAASGWRTAPWTRALAAARRRLPSLAPALASSAAPLAAGALLVLAGAGIYWAAMLAGGGSPLHLDLVEARYPRRGVAFIADQELPPPLFSVNAWGGYEVWRLAPAYRVFFDGRRQGLRPGVLRDFADVVNAGTGWEAVLDRWRVQTVLAQSPSRLVETLRLAGNWRLVFTDRDAAVFVREADANRALLARLERLSRDGGPAGAGGARPAPAAAASLAGLGASR